MQVSGVTMNGAIEAIEFYLPEAVLSTDQLATEFPEWSAEKIDAKTGILERHIAAPDECASDLAVKAAEKVFKSGVCSPDSIDYLLLCTQSPDYFLPTTACLLQDRLGLRTSSGAVDFNLGCSGYVYGLGLAQGLIASGQAARVLLITAETYSKYIHHKDKSVRTIFGDAAAATVIGATHSAEPLFGPFVYGTDGRGAHNLIVKTGAARAARTARIGGDRRRYKRQYPIGRRFVYGRSRSFRVHHCRGATERTGVISEIEPFDRGCRSFRFSPGKQVHAGTLAQKVESAG